MRTPWSPQHAKATALPDALPTEAAPLDNQTEEPEPPRVLRRPERPMDYVAPNWISPVIRQFFSYRDYPRLSPYFEHKEYVIFVEARPYAELVAAFPDEEPVYERGSIWGMCYSSQCVKGEEGHHHLSMLIPISPERFQRARKLGWALEWDK